VTRVACNVEQWLEQLGLARYAAIFAEHEVDLTVLPDLTEQDLKELSIPLGHRKRLLRAIAALSEHSDAVASDRTTLLSPPSRDEAERRQLTVMFCDLVEWTALSSR
jgi:class 3 adenylate cyclase